MILFRFHQLPVYSSVYLVGVVVSHVYAHVSVTTFKAQDITTRSLLLHIRSPPTLSSILTPGNYESILLCFNLPTCNLERIFLLLFLKKSPKSSTCQGSSSRHPSLGLRSDRQRIQRTDVASAPGLILQLLFLTKLMSFLGKEDEHCVCAWDL